MDREAWDPQTSRGGRRCVSPAAWQLGRNRKQPAAARVGGANICQGRRCWVRVAEDQVEARTLALPCPSPFSPGTEGGNFWDISPSPSEQASSSHLADGETEA